MLKKHFLCHDYKYGSHHCHQYNHYNSFLFHPINMSLAIIFSIFFLLITSLSFIIISITKSHHKTPSVHHPKSYPLIGTYFVRSANHHRRVQWTSDVLRESHSATFVMRRFLGNYQVFTGNPLNVEHVLKTHFHIYRKGEDFRRTLFDFLGNGIFNSDGEGWKFQRQVSSYEFNTKSLRKFVETVVDTELSQRLIPIFRDAAVNGTVLDLQDILQRFAFDNICKIAFGYDPKYLLPSLPEAKFAKAFETGIRIISERANSLLPITWKIKRFFCVGSEKQLKEAASQVRDFAKTVINEKKEEIRKNSALVSTDLLSRFLISGLSDDDFVTDIVISFILAGRDTTSAALTWFFWLIYKNPNVETEILKEVQVSETPNLEKVKEMVYTHASLCESMRLYPPVPTDTKVATKDNVLPDGTEVKKGVRVTYHPYAMGRLERIWGSDWADFKPERWLKRDESWGKWSFVARDNYTYPVFQAGPRICLGKEMAFLQMKRVVAGVLSRFKVVPAAEDRFDPVFVADLTTKMKGGFPVRIQERK